MAEDGSQPVNFDQKQENTGSEVDTRSEAEIEAAIEVEIARLQRDGLGQFMQGRSGNPAGRPRGSRNKDRVMLEQRFEQYGGALADKAVEMAMEGNTAALRLCVSRILAPRRTRASEFALPPLRSAADLAPAIAAIAEAVGDGTVSTDEAFQLSQIVDAFGRALAAGDIEARLQKLEAINGVAA